METIIRTGIPTSIAIDQISEHVYWTDISSLGKIQRCNLDGTDEVTILSEGNIWGLAIDLAHR